MKNITKTLFLPILAGVMSLAINCAGGPKYFHEQYGPRLGIIPYEEGKVLFIYDKNGDGIIDTNLLYEFVRIAKDGTGLWKLIGEAHDLNGDNDFNDKGEIVSLE